jgi:hypothetical protein
MRNKRLHQIENIGFYVAIVFASIVITLGFLALVGKIVMYTFS